MNDRKTDILIFDMDGVIVDSEPFHEKARQIMYKEYGVHFDKSFDSPVGKSSKEYWEYIINRCGINGNPDELERQQHRMVADQIKNNRAKPTKELKYIIKKAREKGVILAVASSSSEQLVHDALLYLAIRDDFDIIVSGDDIERRKPFPDVYLKVLERAEISGENAVAVEDSEVGIEAAHRAGIFCYGYRNPTSGNRDISNADIVINSLGEIEI